MDTKPAKHTTGATLMRMVLNISGLNELSVVEPPDIKINPMITTTIPTARRMKLVRSNPKLF